MISRFLERVDYIIILADAGRFDRCCFDLLLADSL